MVFFCGLGEDIRGVGWVRSGCFVFVVVAGDVG